MEETEEEAPPAIANELDQFAEFLDPHLSTSSDFEEPDSTERWSVLKATTVIFVTLLALWALILALIYSLI